MEDLYQKIARRWEKQRVKFDVKGKKPVWKKTLRSVRCALCGKKETEKSFDEGFDAWVWIDLISPDGMYAEVCPDCKKKFGMGTQKARRIRCDMCGVSQKEKIHGIGWPGWFIPTLRYQSTRELVKGVCPNCFLSEVAEKNPALIHSTWYDLTFASGSLLTSAKMTQLDGNLDALAAGDTGAPQIATAALKTTTGSGTSSANERITIAGGQYSFFVQSADPPTPTAITDGTIVICHQGTGGTRGTYYTMIEQYSWTAGRYDWQNRYIQASPPYEIEHFIYIKTDSRGKIISTWEAPDPPWYGQGIDGKATAEEIPSPFLTTKDGDKIILVNPSVGQINELMAMKEQKKRTIASIISDGQYVIEDKLQKPRGKMTERILAKGIEFRKLRRVK